MNPRRERRPPAKKRFGQHFLSDPGILNRIVDAAELAPGDIVLEIGPGHGALTEALAAREINVVAVEIDRDLAPLLRARFDDNHRVRVIEADVLDHAPDELATTHPHASDRTLGGAADADRRGGYVVVANLPYNIAALVLRRLLEARVPPRRLVVMVQREVAEAIVARPGRMSLLSVATQVYGETKTVMHLAPGAFSPPPKVQSSVVRIDVAPEPRVDAPLDAFFRIVRAGFGNPRKQLRNSLSFGLHVKQEVVDAVLARAGIDVTLRPQVLSLDDWAAITRAWVTRPNQ